VYEWLVLLRRPNTVPGRSSFPADAVALNDNDENGITWMMPENLSEVRSEMSNWRKDTCSPISSSTCSSKPEPTRLACS
jgi:hypothetical protein